MILEILDLLTPEELKQLRAIANASTFIDGRITNPHNTTKKNEQIDFNSQGYKDSTQIMMQAISRHQGFLNFTFPNRIAPPLLCKYHEGMKYGVHSDNAFIALQNRQPMRSDVSMTTFLNDPDTYEGGELIMHLESKKVKIKMPAGGTIVYPSTTLHEVAPVTKGERLVSITFVESKFSDERQRHLLYTLGEVEALEGYNIKHENRIKLSYVQQNLQRMWSKA